MYFLIFVVIVLVIAIVVALARGGDFNGIVSLLPFAKQKHIVATLEELLPFYEQLK